MKYLNKPSMVITELGRQRQEDLLGYLVLHSKTLSHIRISWSRKMVLWVRALNTLTEDPD